MMAHEQPSEQGQASTEQTDVIDPGRTPGQAEGEPRPIDSGEAGMDPGRTPGQAEGEPESSETYDRQRKAVREGSGNGHTGTFSFARNEELVATLQKQLDAFRSQFDEMLKRFNESWSQGGSAQQMQGQMRHFAREQNFNKNEVARWVSMIGGGFIVFNGVRRALPNLALASIGAALFYWGWTGQSVFKRFQSGGRFTQQDAMDRINRGETAGTNLSAKPRKVTKTIIVKADVGKVYEAWADFENFPHFMRHIVSVTKTSDDRSHWVMQGPLGQRIEWDAKTTRLEPNKRIGWNSMEGGDITTSGQVSFNNLPNGETEVTATVQYLPPAGMAGEIVAELFGDPERKLEEDLRNFKRFIENR